MRKPIRIALWVIGVFVGMFYLASIALIAGVDAHTVNKEQNTITGLQATVAQQQKAIASLQSFQGEFPTGFGLYLLTHSTPQN